MKTLPICTLALFLLLWLTPSNNRSFLQPTPALAQSTIPDRLSNVRCHRHQRRSGSYLRCNNQWRRPLLALQRLWPTGRRYGLINNVGGVVAINLQMHFLPLIFTSSDETES
ncbi:MAG: hypothetical protein ACOYNY_31810 [Caldilineaceae bacterium]